MTSGHRRGGGVPQQPARRRFVQGLAAGGIVATAPWGAASAASGTAAGGVLSGTEFDLAIGETRVDFTGRTRAAITVNGTLPAPVLRWREGTTVNLRVANALPAGSIHGDVTSIHWHGLLLPADMDGVPGMSFDGIRRGEAYQYRFAIRQNGTYWYHSHSAMQEQAGLYGAIIIDAAEPEPFRYDREHVVLLSDWTDLAPAALFRRLKQMSDHDNLYKRTLADFVRDARADGLRATVEDRRMWAAMRMTPTDLSDVNAQTYTYLMNGSTSLGNWTGLFRSGERVRLRVINGSAMTYFDVRIPGLKMTVVAADGQYVHPVTVDEFRIAAAETYDVIVEPRGEDAFTVFAQDSARTGYVAGTLAVRAGLRAPVPVLDPRPILTMADMGHGTAGHGGMLHGGPRQAPLVSGGAAAGGHGAHHGAGHGDTGHAGMPANAAHVPGLQETSPIPDAHVASTHVDPHAGHRPSAGAGAPAMQHHPASEANSPLVDMQAMQPTPRLDDPGAGLRDNGRSVLTYGALRSLFADPDGREPGRTVELHLTGHMEKFAWSFDGIPFVDASPLRLTYGERLRIVLVNDTMMAHPIHLHGMWSDVEDADGGFMVRKHTVDMPPGTRRSYRVRADALGRWAYHCHMLYHMEAGMFREVAVHEGRA